MDVKLLPGIVDALHGADLLAGPVLYADAGLADHVGHSYLQGPACSLAFGPSMTGVKGIPGASLLGLPGTSSHSCASG
ncbi:hypothetical protein Thermus77412_19370 [Thermus antranikianii]